MSAKAIKYFEFDDFQDGHLWKDESDGELTIDVEVTKILSDKEARQLVSFLRFAANAYEKHHRLRKKK